METCPKSLDFLRRPAKGVKAEARTEKGTKKTTFPRVGYKKLAGILFISEGFG